MQSGQTAVQMVVQGEKKRRWKAVAKLLYCLSDFPQLYIFSTSDHVIPSDSIKAWIKVPLSCHNDLLYLSDKHSFQLRAITLEKLLWLPSPAGHDHTYHLCDEWNHVDLTTRTNQDQYLEL